MRARMLFAATIALLGLVAPRDAVAICRYGEPADMVPSNGSVVPLNVQLVVWPNDGFDPRRLEIELVRVATGDVVETQLAHAGPSVLVRPRSPLASFAVYDVMVVRPGKPPRRLGDITTSDDVDETPPVWNGISPVGYVPWIDEMHPLPRWPGIVADRAILAETAFGVWCAEHAWDPTARPQMVMRGLYRELRPGDVCPRWGASFWIAPIDGAGNIGRPAYLPGLDSLGEYEIERRAATPEGRFDLAAYDLQPGPYRWQMPGPPEVDVAPPPSLLGTTPRRAIAAALALLVLLVARRAVRLRRAATTA